MTNNRGICLSIIDWIPAFRPEVNRPLDDAGMTQSLSMSNQNENVIPYNY